MSMLYAYVSVAYELIAYVCVQTEPHILKLFSSLVLSTVLQGLVAITEVISICASAELNGMLKR